MTQTMETTTVAVPDEQRGVSIGIVDQPRDRTLSDPQIAVRVTPENAITISTVFACIRVLAEGVASLPLKLYRRRTDRGKDLANSHALYGVLHDVANPEMTAFEWRETIMGHLGLWGNAYSEIEMNGRADVLALWPMRPDRVTVIRNPAGDLEYIYDMPDGGQVNLPAYRVLHIRGLSSNGVMGMSPISTLRRTMSLTATTEQFGNTFYANGARPGGILKYPGKLSPEAYGRLKGSWEDRHQGLDKANRVAILEEGMDWQDVSMPLTDAQFLETRKFQRSELAGIFRVPPHMIGDLDKATFSNIEQQSIDFVVNTLRPWLVRIEQRIGLDLIGEIERKTLFAEFLVDGLLRGDIKSRYDSYAVGRNWGWLSANDVREIENQNPVDGGDIYLLPLNMQPANQAGQQQPAQPDPAATRAALLPIVKSTMERIIKRETQDITGQLTKLERRNEMTEFPAWLQRWLGEHRTWVIEQLLPVGRVACELRKDDPMLALDPLVATIADERVGRLAGAQHPMSVDIAIDVEAVLTKLV